MKMICINCPKGCELDVERMADGTLTVTGHTCPRGEAYGRAELENPTRMVTGLVRVAGMRKPLPVKTKSPVAKGKISDVLFAMHQATVLAQGRLTPLLDPYLASVARTDEERS